MQTFNKNSLKEQKDVTALSNEARTNGRSSGEGFEITGRKDEKGKFTAEAKGFGQHYRSEVCDTMVDAINEVNTQVCNFMAAKDSSKEIDKI